MTSDERRETAESLRYLLVGHRIRYKEQFFDDVAEAVVGYEDYHDFDTVIESIADLIDPTASVRLFKVLDEHGQEMVRPTCSACGHVIAGAWAFCPGCGSRLVRADD